MTPFRNNDNFLDSTLSLSEGHLGAITNVFMFFLIRLFDEGGRRTFQVNEWVRLFFRCFTDSESFCISSCVYFNVSYSLTKIWFLTRTCTFVNHTRWMGISTLQFKKLLNFLNHFLCNSFGNSLVFHVI